MEEHIYYSDQSTYDEEECYMEESWTEDEEEYGTEANMEQIDPQPPDYDSDQSDDTRSSSWSKPFKTPYTSNSVIHFNPYRQSLPKYQLYAFSGRNNYLEWEENMADWFHYNHIKEEKRLAYAIEQLYGDAYKWWVQEKAERKRYKEPTITTWKMLKELLRKRYAPKKKIETERSKAKTSRDKVDTKRECKSIGRDKLATRNKSNKQAEALETKQRFKIDVKKLTQEMLEIIEAFTQPRKVIQPVVDQTQSLQPTCESSNEPKHCKISNLSTCKGATCYTCRKKGHIAANCPRRIELTITSVDSDLSSPNSSSEIINESLEISNSSVMHLFLSKDVDSGHTLEHENDKAKESTKEKNQLAVPITSQVSLEYYTPCQGIEFKQFGQSEVEIHLDLSRGTQVTLAYEHIQYFINILFTQSFTQPVLNVEISSIMHLILSFSAKEDTGSFDECNSLKRNTAARGLAMNQTKQPIHLVQKPITVPIPCDCPRKHCKELDLVQTGPNLFVIVSTQDEKRFGLESVKEFRVSNYVFDSLTPYFEAITPERFFNHISLQFDDCSAFRPSLNVSMRSKVFDMFRTKTECALFRTWSELNSLPKCLFIELCKLKDHIILELNQSKRMLDALGNESMLYHLSRLFVFSKRTFDVVSLVLVKIKERQVRYSRAKIIQVMSNQVDYGPMQQLIYHFKIWNWKYLREMTSNDQGSHALAPSKPTRPRPDMGGKPTPKKNTTFRRLRRIQKWEEDQRFKPPDLNQNQHQNFGLFIQIKEKPPDATSKSKTRLSKLGGKFLIIFEFLSTNLLYLHADNLDLRSNPFQVGGDDVILDSSNTSSTSRFGWCGSSSISAILEHEYGYGPEKNSNQEQHIHTLMLEMSIQED